MNGTSTVLDTSQRAYVNGARVMEAMFATCTGQPGTERQLEMMEQHANQIVHTLTACLHAGFGRMYSPGDSKKVFDGKEVDVKYLKKICSTFMEVRAVSLCWLAQNKECISVWGSHSHTHTHHLVACSCSVWSRLRGRLLHAPCARCCQS